ncbi:hypothetical protein [Xanthomonas phaseoli]|uniref:hypothetical protein n=1 Tax=Xanthomonas phaseoli TaxID=1985254 RepID=UPI0003603972|nr:hypothetical protein [Xanthomonas phaseoli]
MIRAVLALVGALLLASCASTLPRRSVAVDVDPADARLLALDAVRILDERYGAGATVVALVPASKDDVLQPRLEWQLRRAGYGVADPSADVGVHLQYLAEASADGGALQLYIGDALAARFYTRVKGELHPARNYTWRPGQ